MSSLPGSQRDPAPDEPGAAIRLGEKSRADDETTHWGLLLVVFMRILAALWIAQGLLHWSALLTSAQPIFDSVPTAVAGATIFFAVLDLVASVGLWLATPWGGVLWLLAATLQIFVAVAIKNFFWFGWVPVNVGLILMYFVMTWQAGQSRGQFRRPPRRR